MLSLGEECPASATASLFGMHNEDNDNQSYVSGDISSGVQNGSVTQLTVCTFPPNSAARGDFPDLGFEYGVISHVKQMGIGTAGTIFIDNEDDDNNDRVPKPFPDGTQMNAIPFSGISQDRNTTFNVVRVR